MKWLITTIIVVLVQLVLLGLVAVAIGVIDDWLDGVNEWQ